MSGTLTRGGTVPLPPIDIPAEVPFLVNNKEKWISGIVEGTTCGDLVKALLAAEGRLKGINEEQLDKFVMVERWRKVERPLRRDSCLLKIWEAWGAEAREVQFVLKRVTSKERGRRQGAKVKRSNSKLIQQLADFEKSKVAEVEAGEEVEHMQGNIQALLKIIISQRETIQSQLGTLKAKDMYLKTLDKSLSCSDGREYVLRNYLEQIPEHAEETLEESQDSGCGSGNDTQDSCTEANTPDHTAEATEPTEAGADTILTNLFEKLFHLNQKLEVQEDDIFRLTLQMEAMVQARRCGVETLTREQEALLHSELQGAQEELDTMAKLNSRLGYEIKRNELALTNMMKNYDGRKQFASRLERDVDTCEASTTTAPVAPLPPSTSFSLKKIEEETDWEEGCSEEEEESEEEELRSHRTSAPPFPVLAPPEQFQNCLSPSPLASRLSPSATYESCSHRPSVASPAYSNDSVSSALSSSTATEKSVRFCDRDTILSTPEPSPAAWWPHTHNTSSEHRAEKQPATPAVKVKSILKVEAGGQRGGGEHAGVDSFLLDREDGTLV